MKMSMQERVILIVFVMVLVSALGVFWFVVPEVQKIQSSNITREAKEKELKEAQDKAATKDSIKESIITAYDESKTMSELFFEKMDTVEADIITRQFINDIDFIKSYSISLSEYSTETLEITSEKEDSKDSSKTTKSAISATVGVNTVSFEVTLPANRFYDLLDEINDYKITENGKEIRKAIYLGGFSEPNIEPGQENADITYSLSLKYFSIERVQEINLEGAPTQENDEAEA